MEKLICHRCKKDIKLENVREDGIPSGVGFVRGNGKMLNLCADCLIQIGAMDEKDIARELLKLKESLGE